MTAQPTLTLTGTGNLQVHIPMRIRRMRGRKMIFAPPRRWMGRFRTVCRKCRGP